MIKVQMLVRLLVRNSKFKSKHNTLITHYIFIC